MYWRRWGASEMAVARGGRGDGGHRCLNNAGVADGGGGHSFVSARGMLGTDYVNPADCATHCAGATIYPSSMPSLTSITTELLTLHTGCEVPHLGRGKCNTNASVVLAGAMRNAGHSAAMAEDNCVNHVPRIAEAITNNNMCLRDPV